MKHILILLIIISFAFGQDIGNLELNMEATDLEMLQYERYQKPFDEKGLIQVTFNDVDTYFPTIRSYELYAEECYNDNIHIKYGLWNMSMDSNGVVSGWQDSIIYIYPTTPTFEGFIEWYELR